MGLSGRKTKQRIGADPRNLTWSDDSSKFGAKYLQSLGWSSGSGLGASGEGRTTNLNIHHKLDLMGIGANRKGPGGDDAGWRGGREFEGLLARLNQAQGAEAKDIPIDEEGAPYNHGEPSPEAEVDSKETKQKRKEETSEKRKRKRSATEADEVDAEEAKRRRKEEKKEKKRAEKTARKQKSRPDIESGVDVAADIEATRPPKTIAASPAVTAETINVAPRYRAHRARNLASKRLAAASSTGMNEILGIAASASSGRVLGTSSVPFPVRVTPPRQQSESEKEDATPGFGLARVQNRLEQTAGADGAGADPISAMGLGNRPAFGGLGFGGAKNESGIKNSTEGGGNDLQRSGKSVAEYFAEKMRLKGIAKEVPVAVGTEVQMAKEPKRKDERKEKK